MAQWSEWTFTLLLDIYVVERNIIILEVYVETDMYMDTN